jgi:hypothetical protein
MTSDDTLFEDLLQSILTWDGTLAGATPLRAAAASVEAPRRKANSERERALMAVCTAYRKRDPGRLVVDPEAAPATAVIYGPFLGDQAIGRWPHLNPATITTDQAKQWLPLVSRFGTPDDTATVAAIWKLFRRRPRRLWQPASRAMACLATRSASARQRLVAEWSEVMPGGLPRNWEPQGLVPHVPARDDATRSSLDRVHRARHVLHAMCAYAGLHGDANVFGVSDVTQVAAMALPPDAADASLLLGAFRELLRSGPLRQVLVPLVGQRVSEARPDSQVEAELRLLADELTAWTACAQLIEAVERRLIEPRWTSCSGTQRVDALWGWLGTVMWADGRGRRDLVDAARALAAEAATAVAIATSASSPAAQADPVEALLPRLRVLLDPLVFATTTDASRATCLAETLLLLRRPALQELPWQAVRARALGLGAAAPPAAGHEALGEAAMPDLVLTLAAHRFMPPFLLRDRDFTQSTVLTLAASQSDLVALQVAVQSERLLREVVRDGEGQVRFFWNVLQQDPPSKLFLELGRLWWDDDGPLPEVAARAQALDACRGSRDGPRIARANAEFVEVLRTLLPEPARTTSDLGVAMGQIAEDLCALERDIEPVGGVPWGSRMRRLMLGQVGRKGLDWFMAWLGKPLPELGPAWARFEQAYDATQSAEAALSQEEYRGLSEAMDTLKIIAARVAWPVAEILENELETVDRWARDLLRQRTANEAHRRQLMESLEARDEEAVRNALALAENGRLLRAEEAERVYEFFRERLLLSQARRLRESMQRRVGLPHQWAHLAPLAQGAVAGQFFVLDIGTAWSELLVSGREPAYWTTFGLGLAVSYLMLLSTLVSAARLPSNAKGLWLRFAGRVLLVWLAAFGLASLVTLVVMLTLEGTSLRTLNGTPLAFVPQWLLWSSLSIVLGVLLQLVLQGRGPTEGQ